MNSFLRTFLIILFTISFLLMSKAILINNFPDFNNFYYSPTLIFNNINPYLDKDTLFTSQTYPPHVFIIAYPLQFLPLIVMSKIWTLGSIIALLASIYILLKINNEKFSSNTGLLISSLTFLAFPVKFTLGMGQINIYVLLALTLFIFYLKKNEILAGTFLFTSLALKIFPIFLPVYLILMKRWKILFTIFSLGLILMSMSYLVFGYQMMNYFIFDIFPTLVSGWKGDYYNQSLSGFLIRTGVEIKNLEILRLVLSLSLVFITFIIILKNKSKELELINLKIGAVLVLNVLVNNFSWQHHFVWLIPSFFYTFFYLKKMRANLASFLILGFSYFLVSYNIETPNAFPTLLLSHVFWGSIILLGINLYLLLPEEFKKRIIPIR